MATFLVLACHLWSIYHNSLFPCFHSFKSILRKASKMVILEHKSDHVTLLLNPSLPVPMDFLCTWNGIETLH